MSADSDNMFGAIARAIENHREVFFLWPMQPLHTVGPIAFSVSSDAPVIQRCEVDEHRYRVSDRHKITLWAQDHQYGRDTYYQSDLVSLMRAGCGQLFIDGEEFRLDYYNVSKG